MDDRIAAWVSVGTALLVGALYIFVQVWSDYLIDVQALVCCGISTIVVVALYGMIYKVIEDEADCGAIVLFILCLVAVGVIAFCNVEMLLSAYDIMTVKSTILNDFLLPEAVETSIFFKALIMTPAYGNTAAVAWLLFSLWKGDGYGDTEYLKWTPIAYVQAYIISLILLAIFSVYTALIIVVVIIGILALFGLGSLVAMIRGD